jgi:hypothetical protein
MLNIGSVGTEVAEEEDSGKNGENMSKKQRLRERER